jgi:hypothetical protein
METKNAPAAEKAGRQRAASHNKIGNNQVIGTGRPKVRDAAE